MFSGGMPDRPIVFFNRYTHRLEEESVYGENSLKWAYGKALGKATLRSVLVKPWFSKYYGWLMDRPKSARRICPFVEKFEVDMSVCEKSIDEFSSFNDFFYRTFKPEARPIVGADVVFPADGRHMGFADASAVDGIFVKGQKFNIRQLLEGEVDAENYINGTVVLSRLCPVDYHRFHFPVSGRAGASRVINGPLFSVNPFALRRNVNYLFENKRAVTSIVTENLGVIKMIEIGATCVGSIIQTYAPGEVKKGQEKGYFRFGGSSAMLVFEKDRVQLAADLLEHSALGRELYAKMGDNLGSALEL